MERTFGLVDEKLAEADFFLERLSDERCAPFEARCFFSAFVAAARSVTFSLQAVMNDTQGFREWYELRREQLRADPLARFFHQARTDSQHIGVNPVNSGTSSQNGGTLYYFSNTGDGGPYPNAPPEDVATACRMYMRTVVQLIHECYRDWGSVMDPGQYYTLANLHALGISLEDVEESLGLPRGYTAIPSDLPNLEEERLKALRREIPMASIDWVFKKYMVQGDQQITPESPAPRWWGIK